MTKDAKQRRRCQRRRRRAAKKCRRRNATWRSLLEEANGHLQQGDHDQAGMIYERVAKEATDRCLRALGVNGSAVMAALEGALEAAVEKFRVALESDPSCGCAQENWDLLRQLLPDGVEKLHLGESSADQGTTGSPGSPIGPSSCRVAVLSALFNWPSTAGGIVHTIELNHFLARAGYEVQHIFARYLPWGIGRLEDSLPYDPVVLEFDEGCWNPDAFQARFRQAVVEFNPDWVIITDSWNTKPLLAEAVYGYPYLLRLQAEECLCPLNNLRLLPSGRLCPMNQFANQQECVSCLQTLGHTSGELHRLERQFAGVGTPRYSHALFGTFRNAEAVLVVNPNTEALLKPYCKQVRVVTSGFDAARFPWPWPKEPPKLSRRRTGILMAGNVSDPIKGFLVLHNACRQLWRCRRDFELLVTADPAESLDEFTRRIGWCSQEELPQVLRGADIIVLPAIAAEALGRTAVEAMAVGRPVIASRIGGLPYTVSEDVGLLFEPGDASNLASQIAHLLNNSSLRERLGAAGRKRFEQHYTWEGIIEQHYRPLLQPQSVCVADATSSG